MNITGKKHRYGRAFLAVFLAVTVMTAFMPLTTEKAYAASGKAPAIANAGTSCNSIKVKVSSGKKNNRYMLYMNSGAGYQFVSAAKKGTSAAYISVSGLVAGKTYTVKCRTAKAYTKKQYLNTRTGKWQSKKPKKKYWAGKKTRKITAYKNYSKYSSAINIATRSHNYSEITGKCCVCGKVNSRFIKQPEVSEIRSETHSIHVTWGKVDRAGKYIITDTDNKVVGTAYSTEYNIGNLQSGKQYTYYIAASDSNGNMSGQTEFTATTKGGENLTDMENYPGLKHFNFAENEVTGTSEDDWMVEPERSIKIEKTMPDEYFGAKTTTRTDSYTGEVVTGLALGGMESSKGSCGAITHNAFQYEGNWIDIKTTYIDWQATSRLASFYSGGFFRQRWRSVKWLEMKHEFFIAGTNTPVEIKGFLSYVDIDDSQGIMIESDKTEGVWTHAGGTTLKYEEIPANRSYVPYAGNAVTPKVNMLYLQSFSEDDLIEEGTAGHDAEKSAKCSMGFTFTASTIYTCITDAGSSGLNLIESGQYTFLLH